MSFKMFCPHCKRTLNVNETALGKTVPCPGCNQQIKVVRPPEPSLQSSHSDGPPVLAGATQESRELRSSAPPLPPWMSPIPGGERPAAPPSDPLSMLEAAAAYEKAAPRHKSNAVSAEARASSDKYAAVRKRPAALVWIVFFWAVSAAFVTLSSLAGLIAGCSAGLGLALALSRLPHIPSDLQAPPAIAVELWTFACLLGFYFGLLMTVACYGLWTFRMWGLSLAKKLAIANAIGGLLTVVLAIIVRAGIAASLVGSITSVAILVYLYGSRDLSERLQQAWSRAQHLEDQAWEEYE